MTKTYKLPLNGWQVSSKKKVAINLNQYRNMHYQTSNKLKHMVSDYLMQYSFNPPPTFKIQFTLYFKDKRRRDLSNFESIANKFILDALVQQGVIKDDDYTIYRGYSVEFGGYSDENYIEFSFV